MSWEYDLPPNALPFQQFVYAGQNYIIFSRFVREKYPPLAAICQKTGSHTKRGLLRTQKRNDTTDFFNFSKTANGHSFPQVFFDMIGPFLLSLVPISTRGKNGPWHDRSKNHIIGTNIATKAAYVGIQGRLGGAIRRRSLIFQGGNRRYVANSTPFRSPHLRYIGPV